jgi:hypothetical protein
MVGVQLYRGLLASHCCLRRFQSVAEGVRVGALSRPSIGASRSPCGGSLGWCGSADGLGQNLSPSATGIIITPLTSLFAAHPVFDPFALSVRIRKRVHQFNPSPMVFARVANLLSPGDTSNLVDDGRDGPQHTMESLEHAPVNRAEAVAEDVDDLEASRPPYIHVG